MKSNWKKIIAKEGLIFLSCIGIFLIVCFLIARIPNDSLKYAYEVYTNGHTYQIATDQLLYFKIKGDIFDKLSPSTPHSLANSDDELELFQAIKKQHPYDFQDPFYAKKPNEVPTDLKFKYLGENKTILNAISDNSLSIILSFLFLYPIFLLFRFIFWAIRTLKSE